MFTHALRYAQALYRPSLYYLTRILDRKRRPLHECADATELICQGRKIRAFRFFFRSTHLDRIRDSTILKAEEIVRSHFHREYFDLYPLRICRFSDAWLINGSVFLHKASRIELRSAYGERSWTEDKSLFPTWPVAEVSEAVLGSGLAGSTWFGHWLEDELPLQMLATKCGPVISHARPLYIHELPYLEKLGLNPPMHLRSAHFKSLVVIDEFGQNPDKVRRFLDMRKLLSLGERKHERLYIRRGTTGTSREILNEARLHSRLVAEGYGVIDLEYCTFKEMHEACRQARIIVGIEGSHLAHALFMAADHACLVILNPPAQTHTTIADLAPFCGLYSAMYVCMPENERGTLYTADIDEVLKFIDDAEYSGRQHTSMIDAFIADVFAAS
jgi:hypothetical protein